MTTTNTPTPETHKLVNTFAKVRRPYTYEDTFNFVSYQDAHVNQYLHHGTPLLTETAAYVNDTVLPAAREQLAWAEGKLAKAQEQGSERRTTRYTDLSTQIAELVRKLEQAI